MTKRGLGKGFGPLIPTNIINTDFDTTAEEDERVSDLRTIDINDIIPNPDQPRRTFDENKLEELAKSIKEQGVLQPIVVSPHNGKYEIVAGERRWRASKIAGLKKMPAIIRTLSDQHRLEISIIENVQRDDLNPIETATGFMKLKSQFNMTDAEIGKRVGKATSTVANIVRLANLPDAAKKALAAGKISEGHARQILAISEPEVQQQLLDNIVDNGWTVRRAEQFVIGYKNGTSGKDRAQRAVRATRSETPFTKNIAKKLGFKDNRVVQKTMAHGGQIIIKYKSDDDIKKIATALGVDIEE